jgi:Pectate lyase superfamily protein/Right handed beta helix region
MGLLPTSILNRALGHISQTIQAWRKLNNAWLDVVADYGAVGDNTTDDWSVLNAAINDCPAGGTVYFPPLQYVVTNELPLRTDITYRMGHPNRWSAYTGTPAYIKPKFGAFLGSALFSATETDGVHMVNMGLQSGRATGPGGAVVHAIKAVGACKGWRLENVWANNFSGYGLLTDTSSFGFPGGWEVTGLDVENNALGGMRSQNTGGASFAFGDGTLLKCESTSNGGPGLKLDGAVALSVINWRTSFDGDEGMWLDGPSGTVTFLGCQSDRAVKNGLRLHAVDSTPGSQPSPHSITVSACHFRRDGKNDDATQGGFAGISIEGDSAAAQHCLVTVQGCTVGDAKDDTGAGLLSPDYGIKVTNGRRVLVNGCTLTATVAPISDDGSAVIADGNAYNLANVSTGAITYDVTPGGWARRQYREKSADQSVTASTTLVAVNDLVASVQPNTRYDVTLNLIYDAAAAADLKIGWTGPAGATMDWTPAAPGTGATAAPFPLDIGLRSITSTPALGAVGVGTKILATARGRLVVGATGGTLQLTFAQNTSDASNATVSAGSWLRLERIN